MLYTHIIKIVYIRKKRQNILKDNFQSRISLSKAIELDQRIV